jgi:N-acetylglucosamine malate deacetylase 1
VINKEIMKLDILAIGIHPDDVELSCGGTLIKHVALGFKVGIIDLTYGEMGTRGSKEIRLQEAENAKNIIGAIVRENLGFRDCFANNDEAHQLALIKIIRKYQPDIILTNAPRDRHPDHGLAAEITYDACFKSGLRKIETDLNGVAQSPWRPKVTYNYIQGRYIDPDMVVDITGYFDQKMESVKAHASQFFDPNNPEENTFISDSEFLEMVKGRDILWGKAIGVKYAEGFLKQRYIGIDDITKLI